uniref:Aminotransferase n=1 Tax=candidate division WOR-3 bacterium TaxID=2052148 RepID=A0A7C3N8M3_UNCW3
MFSQNLNKLPLYLFDQIDKMKKSIPDPIDFGVGDPDIPTPKIIVDELIKNVKKSENHKYPPYDGILELKKEISEYFKKRFSVNLDPEKEVLVLIGSKEGIAHSLEAFLNRNDKVLIPSICYPVYKNQTILKGGKPVEYKIRFENNFVPEISEIEKKIDKKTKILFLNYPNNPTGAKVKKEFYDRIYELCAKKNIMVLNDNVYSEIYFDDSPPPSFLQSDRDKNLSCEFHSFSKVFNMTGWRIGFLVGNQKMIEMVKKIKTNTDSGVFIPIQKASIAGLKNIEKIKENNIKIFKKRMEILSEHLYSKGFEFHKPVSTYYIFTKTLKNMDSLSFTKLLLQKAGIVTTPGIGFGKDGDRFVRFSITLNEKDFYRGIEKIKRMKI